MIWVALCVQCNAVSGQIPLKRVKWSSKLEHEYISNFKVLQGAFKKLGVEQVRRGTGRKGQWSLLVTGELTHLLIICHLMPCQHTVDQRKAKSLVGEGGGWHTPVWLLVRSSVLGKAAFRSSLCSLKNYSSCTVLLWHCIFLVRGRLKN